METRYNELFSRNIRILTEKEQEKLSNSRIAIAEVDYCRRSFDVIMDRNWKDFWSKFSKEAYDNIILLPENKKMLSRIAELAGTNKKVLDAGCGTGNLTIKLAENNEVTAIDFSPGMIAATMEKIKAMNNVAVKQGDVNSLQFPDKSFDIVTSVNVLFNLENPKKAIKEAHRVLKDDGLFIVSSPLKHEGLTKEFLDKVFVDGKQGGVEKERIIELLDFNKIVFSEGGMKFAPEYPEILNLMDESNFAVVKADKIYYDTNFLIVARKK